MSQAERKCALTAQGIDGNEDCLRTILAEVREIKMLAHVHDAKLFELYSAIEKLTDLVRAMASIR